ncbi:hypothetical protein WR25_11225 [Diploscapter pachys]|uniref:C2H2-type domain-containing protein n=1 Tax=Diploscapter pachys TaxID=2018661 RepID=A0A2A2KI29_9BILA|nr:hypothetical protein WR25_11225 [Diploscapter pachys]
MVLSVFRNDLPNVQNHLFQIFKMEQDQISRGIYVRGVKNRETEETFRRYFENFVGKVEKPNAKAQLSPEWHLYALPQRTLPTIKKKYNSAKNFREDFFQLLMAERCAQKKLADEMTTFLTSLETMRNGRKEIVFAFKIPSLFDQGFPPNSEEVENGVVVDISSELLMILYNDQTFRRMIKALSKFENIDHQNIENQYLSRALLGMRTNYDSYKRLDRGFAMSKIDNFPVNREQIEAVYMSNKFPILLVHGPPGTGKTFTAALIIFHWIKKAEDNDFVLVVAPSNVVADELVIRIRKTGLPAVRLYAESKEALDNRAGEFGLHNLILKDDNQEFQMLLKKREVDTLSKSEQKRFTLLKTAAELKILTESRICVATCATSASPLFEEIRPTHLLLDEAAQATVPEAMIPLMTSPKKFVLLGDTRQLPPLIISVRAKKAGLECSIMERLMQVEVPNVKLLDQYRMHCTISSHPNAMKGISPTEVAVISFYDPQSELIKRMFNNNIQNGAAYLRGVEIRNVDGFQGREKQIVLVSTVRSNESGSVGFMKDHRRANVAMTRAKCGLLIVGNHKCLSADATWNALLKQYSKENAIIDGSTLDLPTYPVEIPQIQESAEIEAEDFPDEFESTFTPYFTETEAFICNVCDMHVRGFENSLTHMKSVPHQEKKLKNAKDFPKH